MLNAATDLRTSTERRLDASLANYCALAEDFRNRSNALANGSDLDADEEMNFGRGTQARHKAAEHYDELAYAYITAYNAMHYVKHGVYPDKLFPGI